MTSNERDQDEAIEIGNKNYSRIAQSLEKEGFSSGIDDGRNSLFQQSFDHGYEDGFKMGFMLKDEKQVRKNCCMCVDQNLFKNQQVEDGIRNVREIIKNTFESLNKS